MINNTIKYIFNLLFTVNIQKQISLNIRIPDLPLAYRFQQIHFDSKFYTKTKSKPKFIEDFRAQKLGEPLIITSILHDLEEISNNIGDRF